MKKRMFIITRSVRRHPPRFMTKKKPTKIGWNAVQETTRWNSFSLVLFQSRETERNTNNKQTILGSIIIICTILIISSLHQTLSPSPWIWVNSHPSSARLFSCEPNRRRIKESCPMYVPELPMLWNAFPNLSVILTSNTLVLFSNFVHFFSDDSTNGQDVFHQMRRNFGMFISFQLLWEVADKPFFRLKQMFVVTVLSHPKLW